MGHDAFISYSHAGDAAIAEAIQFGLERLAKPWQRRKALSIFRDNSSLGLTSALWPSIARALDEAEWIIVLLSPESSSSDWVNREVAHWLETKEAAIDRLLIVLTRGTLEWDRERGRFDPDRSTALPAALVDIHETEPRWLDARWLSDELDQGRSEESANLDHPLFRSSIAELAAPIRDMEVDELGSEIARQHNRTRRYRNGAVSGLVILTATATVFGVLSVRRAAELERRQTEIEALALSDRARLLIGDDRALALSVAMEAVVVSDGSTEQAHGAWFESLDSYHRGFGLERYGPILDGQAGPILAASYSPSGALLATGSDDGRVLIWDTTNGQPATDALTSHTDAVHAVAFSPDGKWLVSSGSDDTIRVWETDFWTQAADPMRAADGRAILDLEFSPDGSLLAGSGSAGVLTLWETTSWAPSGVPLDVDTTGSFVGALEASFSPDGKLIASGNLDGTIKVWDVDSRELVRDGVDGETEFLYALDFDPAGRLVLGLFDGTISTWDPATGRRVGVTIEGISSGLSDLQISPDGDVIVSAHFDGTLRVLDATTGNTIGAAVSAHTGTIEAVTFSENAALLASSGRDGRTKLWRIRPDDPAPPGLSIGSLSTDWVAFSPNDSLLALKTAWTDILLYDAHEGVLEARLNGLAVDLDTTRRAAFSPNGAYLASVTSEGSILLWSLETHELILRHDLGPVDLNAVAFSPDSSTLYSADGLGTIEAWTIDPSGHLAMNEMAASMRHPGSVYQLLASSDGELLASIGDGAIRFWSLPDGSPSERRPPLDYPPSASDVVFSSDWNTAASGKGNLVHLWDLRTGDEIGRPLAGHTDSVQDIAYVPSHDLFASSGDDGTIRFWKPGLARQVGQLTGFGDLPPRALAFTKDGNRLVVSGASEGRLLSLWPCEELGRRTTADQVRGQLISTSEPMACELPESWPTP